MKKPQLNIDTNILLESIELSLFLLNAVLKPHHGAFNSYKPLSMASSHKNSGKPPILQFPITLFCLLFACHQNFIVIQDSKECSCTKKGENHLSLLVFLSSALSLGIQTLQIRSYWFKTRTITENINYTVQKNAKSTKQLCQHYNGGTDPGNSFR